MAVAASTRSPSVPARAPAPGTAPVEVARPVRAPSGHGGTWTMTAVFALVGGLFIAGARMETVQLSYELTQLRSQQKRAEADASRLRAELASLRSPEQLAPLAVSMGLHAPDPGQVRRVDAP